MISKARERAVLVSNGCSSHLTDSECFVAFTFDFFVLENVLDFFSGKASSWSLARSRVMHRVHGISMGEARAGIAAITSWSHFGSFG